MTDEERKDLLRRRRVALEAFLEENAALFGYQPDEIELDDDVEPLTGPFVIEKWALLLCERNLGAVDEGHFLMGTYFSHGMGSHELIGMLEIARDRER